MGRSRPLLIAFTVVVVVRLPAARSGSIQFVETFDDDPVVAGRFYVLDGDPGRFTYDGVGKRLTAQYDTGVPTARLVRMLPAVVNQDDGFSLTVDFTIRSQGFYAAPEQAAQIAFGLINTRTTGPDRPGGNGGDAYDVVSMDYFPNESQLFEILSLGPTIINSASAVSYFDSINFEYGPETSLADEGPLPLDAALSATVSYARAAGTATLTVAGPSGLLEINLVGAGSASGGPDGETTTIQTEWNGVGFEVDAFGFLLWQDTWSATSTVIATVDFDRVEFVAQVPDPGDLDGDGDVDEIDYNTLAGCYTGSDGSIDSGCRRADLDGDADVDLVDFATFQTLFTGPTGG